MARRPQIGSKKSIAFAGEWENLPYVADIENRTLTDLNHRDAFTTSCDFIISPHSGAKGLYVATCGSFHGYKFFPVLGKYIIQMMEGELSPNLREKWAWDRERPDGADYPDFPRFEMNDLLDHNARL